MIDFQLIEPDNEIYAELSGRFEAYNMGQSTWNWQSFCFVLKDGARITAGGRGIVNMGALEVRGLWVDEELRGTGLGGALLKAIEDEARRRGARKVMLYTYSWQAENFYLRRGYEVFARFQYPDGPERIDMEKPL